MRITDNTMSRNFLSNLNRNLQNMTTLQDQQASGKKIRKPSDDPFSVTRSMELNGSINRNNQYLRNINDASAWINTTDTALGQIGDSLNRIGELLEAASNGTNSQTEQDAYKAEIMQKIDEIVQAGNTNFAGKYIFGGHNTLKPPFVNNNGLIEYNENESHENVIPTGAIYREISPGVKIQINVTGESIMDGKDINGNAVRLPEIMKKIVDGLTTDDKLSLSGLIDDVEGSRDNVLRLRAEVGAKANRMVSAKNKNEEESFNMTSVLSGIEDVDVVEITVKTKVAEAVYQSALMAGARIIQPTLLDFLK